MRSCLPLLFGSLLSALTPAHALAHSLSAAECRELSEFLKHTAMSRDNGYSEQFLMSKIEEDLIAIRAFPPDLRWVAQDPDDEQMLIGAARRLFREPQSPEQHETSFLSWCYRRYVESAPVGLEK